MKRYGSILVTALACCAVGLFPAWAGNVVGKITYGGTAPAPKPIAMTKDKEVCSREQHFDESLVVAADKGIANVVVYIKDAPNAPKMAAQFPRQMLHAWKLGFTHPRSEKWMEFEAPIPEDFRDALDRCAPSS